MNAVFPVVIAPYFHLDTPTDRLLLADGNGWRVLNDEERVALHKPPIPDELSSCVLLFTLPARLCAASWAVLEQTDGKAGFKNVAAEIGKFLNFKQLQPPQGALFELVIQGPTGTDALTDLWAVVNLGDDPALIGLPGIRLRLGVAEGCRLPKGYSVSIAPSEGDIPHVLLLIRAGRKPECRFSDGLSFPGTDG